MPAPDRPKEIKQICKVNISLMIVLLTLAVSVFIGCGGGSGSGNNNNNQQPAPKTYSVSFITNGGSSVMARSVQQGGAITTSPETTRAGYVFDGWFTDNNIFVNKVSFPYTPTGNITLYAKWTQLAGTYTVMFEVNGGSYLATLDDITSVASEPYTSRAGYDFDGWFTTSSFSGSRITFPYTVTQNTTLYAKWTQKAGTYTVTFVTNGGSSLATLTNVDSIATEPHTSRSDYDFDGWFTTSSFSGSRITFPYTATGNITLYAKWTPAQTFTVTFNSNGGSTVAPVKVYDTVSAPKRPTKNCDIFDGWYFDNTTFTNRVNFPYTVTGNITLYAKWRQETEAACIGAAEFDNIRNNLAGNYRLSADISLEVYGNWIPIGTESAPFTGTIDGNGYKITGLTITGGGTEDLRGLFGYVSGGTITNLTIENVNIVGGVVNGAIAGALHNNSTITGCYSTGNISVSAPGYYSYSGGIAGSVSASTITDCYSAVNISASTASILGGIAGRVIRSTITDSYSTGNISNSSSSYNDSRHGGIAGTVYDSAITGCHSTGNISAKRISGGIAGWAEDSTITDCYSTGNISASNPSSAPYSGGIVGMIEGNSTITGCHSTGNISTSNYSTSYTGGIAGRATNSGNTITNCYSTGNISSTTTLSYSGGIVGVIEDRGTITDCHSTGNISSYESSGGIAGEVYNSTITGCYSTGEITTQYGGVAGGIAGYVSFKNTYANGSTISDCYSTGTVGGSSQYSGGIVGYIDSSTVTRCYSTGNISTNYNYVEGLITPKPTSADSSSGGIAGNAIDGRINDSYSTGNIFANIRSSVAIRFYSYAGGIVGYSGTTHGGAGNNGTTITGCYSSGDIDSSVSAGNGTVYSYAGGISGNRGSLSIPTNCAAINKRIVALTNAYRIGGGSNNFALDAMTAAGSAKFEAADTASHGVSKTDAQLKTQGTYSGAVNGNGLGGLGWKFGSDGNNPWKMPAGGGYPILYWQ